MRINAKGQVTIPVEIRRRAGPSPQMEVAFEYDGDSVRVIPCRNGKPLGRAERIVEHLGRHGGDVPMTTDEIMALMRGARTEE